MSNIDDAVRDEATSHLNIARAEIKKARNLMRSSSKYGDLEEIITWLEGLAEEIEPKEDVDEEDFADIVDSHSSPRDDEPTHTKFKA